MAQSPAERRRAQRQLAKELREQRAGRATRERGAAGRAYRREIERRNLPVFRRERERLIGGGPSEGPRTPPGGGGEIDRDDLEEAFQNNLRDQIGHYLKYNHQNVVSRSSDPEITPIEDLIWGAQASEEELIARAEADNIAVKAGTKAHSGFFYH